MIDLLATHLALRTRALSAVIASTGSTLLSATSTGYHRAAGSFLTDNFAAGMEITPTGFAANTVDVLTGVTATDLTTKNARSVEAEAGGRTIAVGVPALRAFENVNLTPTAGRPYIEEDFVPATSGLRTFPAQGGTVEETGLYVLKVYGLPGIGISAIRKTIDALKALFAPGTALAAGSNTVRVRADVSVQSGQIIPQSNGWSVAVLTIPWWALSSNVVTP